MVSHHRRERRQDTTEDALILLVCAVILEPGLEDATWSSKGEYSKGFFSSTPYQNGGLARHTTSDDAAQAAQQSQRCLRDSSHCAVTAVIWLRLAVGNAVTFLIESSRRHRPQGLLLRFGRVYLGYITQGDAGDAPAGCYEPTVQVHLFPYTLGCGEEALHVLLLPQNVFWSVQQILLSNCFPIVWPRV